MVVSDGTITDSSLLTIIVEVAGSGATADVVWTDLTDVTNPAGSELVRDVDEEGHLAWTAGAISVQEIAGDDCFVRTTIIETDTDRILGFGDVYNRDNRVSEFIYGVWIRSGGYLNTLLNGVLEFKGGTVTYQTGDEVEVAIVGTTVVYKLNGTVFATSGRPVLRDDYPLRIEAGLLQDNATLSNVVTCPTVPASPYITGLAIEDPTEADDVYGVGDKFTISFNIETNQPNASFNDLFTMSESPGTLSGAWANATTYCATVTDTGGLSNIRIGVTTVVPNLGGHRNTGCDCCKCCLGRAEPSVDRPLRHDQIGVHASHLDESPSDDGQRGRYHSCWMSCQAFYLAPHRHSPSPTAT